MDCIAAWEAASDREVASQPAAIALPKFVDQFISQMKL